MASVTVRTFRYYEEIKLVMPAFVIESGHRLYIPGQLATLKHIADSETPGLSLEVIREKISKPL